MKLSLVLPYFALLATVVFGQQQPGDIVVAKDGTGQFSSLQAAINYVADNTRARIYVKRGTYVEKIVVPARKTPLTIVGENKSNTIISYNDYSGKPLPGGGTIGTNTSYSFLVQAPDFTATDLTIQNTAGPDANQAVALHIKSDRVIIRNCNLIGDQDTVYLNAGGARNYFVDCHVEGTTDFIFGESIALFDNCSIRSKKNSYITAASTPQGQTYGIVFQSCTLSAVGATSVYLGRVWKPYAKTVYLNTRMASHIIPAGWHNFNNPDHEATAYYAEYGTQGVDVSQRVRWSRQLTANEANQYTLRNIFNGWLG